MGSAGPSDPPCMECDYIKKGYDNNDPTVYILLIKYKLYKTIYIIINNMYRTIYPSNNIISVFKNNYITS